MLEIGGVFENENDVLSDENWTEIADSVPVNARNNQTFFVGIKLSGRVPSLSEFTTNDPSSAKLLSTKLVGDRLALKMHYYDPTLDDFGSDFTLSLKLGDSTIVIGNINVDA